MAACNYRLFDTAFAACGLAWSDSGLTQVRLPDHSGALTRANLLARQPLAEHCPDGGPPFVAAVCSRRL